MVGIGNKAHLSPAKLELGLGLSLVIMHHKYDVSLKDAFYVTDIAAGI